MARYIGNYTVIRELGSGHFGTVYLATGEVPGRRGQPARQRIVAIKKLKDADSRSVRLLLQEFALLDQVKHRCIVRVFEFLEEESAVVMEYIHGVTLRQMFEELERSREQVFTEAAIEIASEIADALYQAFTTPGDNGNPLQLVHRDLKPANIMLTPTGEVKLLDWGLARVENTDFRPEARNRVKGTLLYMAPEQAMAQEVDHRTDLYALGLILYELLESKQVYQVPVDAADPVAAVKELVRTGDTRTACSRLEKRFPSIGPIITQALQARPEDRYRNGQDMMVDLHRQLYRDRGAYLEEFCEFFFGSLYDLPKAETIESLSSSSGVESRPRGRMSIEERLRQSIAQEDDAQKMVQRTRAPRAARERGSDPPAGRESGVDDSATGTSPPPPRTDAPAYRVKQVGQRSPDETGMLEMVPLSGVGQAVDGPTDPSATAFFAIPAPKSEHSAKTATPTPVGPPPPSGAGRAPPPPPPVPPIGGGSHWQGSSPGGAPPPPSMPMVRGPVAPPTSSTPFQVSGQVPTAGNNANRVNSSRVFAILFAVFVIVCMAVFLAVVLDPGETAVADRDDDEQSASEERSSSSRYSSSSSPEDESEDEESSNEEEPSSQGTSSTQRPTRPTPSTPQNTSPSTPAPPSPSRTGVLLRVPDTFLSMAGLCGSSDVGTDVSDQGTVRLPPLAVGTECNLRFFGGGGLPRPAFFLVSSADMTCSESGARLTCE